jgi:hypothetical protein
LKSVMREGVCLRGYDTVSIARQALNRYFEDLWNPGKRSAIAAIQDFRVVTGVSQSRH